MCRFDEEMMSLSSIELPDEMDKAKHKLKMKRSVIIILLSILESNYLYYNFVICRVLEEMEAVHTFRKPYKIQRNV